MSNFPISSRRHDSTLLNLRRNLDELQDQRFTTEVLDKLLHDLGLPLGFRSTSDAPLAFNSIEMFPHFLWRRWIAVAFWIQSLMRRNHHHSLVTVEAVSPKSELAMPEGGVVLVIRFALDGGSDARQTRLIPVQALSTHVRAQLRRRFAEYLVSLREKSDVAEAPDLTTCEERHIIE